MPASPAVMQSAMFEHSNRNFLSTEVANRFSDVSLQAVLELDRGALGKPSENAAHGKTKPFIQQIEPEGRSMVMGTQTRSKGLSICGKGTAGR
jgi:hypothetical protein